LLDQSVKPRPSESEGEAIARARIAEEKEKGTGLLDLGRLVLTKLPEELFDLEHLRGLNLGSAWRDQQGEWHAAVSHLARNQPRGSRFNPRRLQYRALCHS
jgi:internalin A